MLHILQNVRGNFVIFCVNLDYFVTWVRDAYVQIMCEWIIRHLVVTSSLRRD